MVNRSKDRKSVDILLFILITIFIIGAILSCLPFDVIEQATQGKIQISNTDYSITTNSTDGLGEFADGKTYLYTDKDKVEDFRKGYTDNDITTQSVNKSDINRGGKENPYVISTTEHWEKFVQLVAQDSDHGSGDYFVLANDLDFNDVNFHPVTEFRGTFCGMGKAIKNITCMSWQYWTGSGYASITTQTTSSYGLFCKTDGAIITDLILENFSYQQMPAYNSTIFENRSLFVGGIIGFSIGEDYVLNCHTVGEVKSNIKYSYHNVYGGVIGEHGNCSKDILIYRCSSEFTCDVTKVDASYCVMAGGILGESCVCDKTVKIYDCVANVKYIIPVVRHAHFAGISGLFNTVSEVYLENLISSVDSNISAAQDSGVLGCFWNGTQAYIKNSYVVGKHGASGAQKSMYFATRDSLSTMKLIENVNLAKEITSYAAVGTTAYLRVSPSKLYDIAEYSTPTESMLSDAKAFFSGKPYSQIWDTEKIGGTYDPDNTPVRNYLLAYVKYRNLINRGNGAEEVGIEDGKEYLPNSDLEPEPSASYMATKNDHIFLGWTDDVTGESEPFKKLPSGKYGDVTLYAVWDMPASARSASITAKNDVSSMEYGVGAIVLEGNVSSSCITEPNITYKWQKISGTVVSGSQTCSLREVNESGDYVLNYVIADSNEPLWRHKDVTTSFHAEITPGILSVRKDSFRLTSHGYVGMQLEEISFEVTMENRSGNPVSGVASWNRTVQVVDRDALTDDNRFATKIKFVPDAGYNGNYDASGIYDVEFQAEFLKIVYKLMQISDTIECEVAYNENIPSTRIVNMFYAEFDKRMSEGVEGYGDLKNLTPYFGEVMISEYDTDIEHIKEEKEIDVNFKVAQFSVTFDPRNGEAPIQKDGYYYNNVILNKDIPTTPVNNGMLFRGWYIDGYDDDGNPTSTKWDFLNDKVTGNITLVGKWLDISLLNLTDLKVDAEKEVEARQPITEGALKVVATYEGTVDGEYLKETVELEFGTYSVEYESGDGMVHVLTPGVTVKYTHRGTTKTVDIDAIVAPIDVDTSMLTFENKEVEYDGNIQYIDEIQGLFPSSINKLQTKYIYRKGGVVVESDKVIEPGLYTVTAEFVMNDTDYLAKPMTATLEILSPATSVTVEWDTDTLTYNGKVQHPTATLKDASGKVINVNIDYIFESVEAITVGKNYKVTAVIDRNTGYQIIGEASITFSIEKAILDTPTLKGAIYYDGMEINLENDLLNGFIPEIMKIEDGTATDAGDYYAQIVLSDLNNCEWKEGGLSVTIKWTINKAHLTARWDAWEFLLMSGVSYSPKVNGFIGLKDADKDKIDYDNDLIYFGVYEASEAGAYEASVAFSGNGAWSKNYDLDGNTKLSWVITPRSGMQIISVEWSIPEEGLVYNGKVQRPTYKVLDINGEDITANVKLTFSGDYETSKWADKYTVSVSVDENSNYFIRSGATYEYEILTQEDGTGEKPDDEDNNDDSIGNGNIVEFLQNYWQPIVALISIILILVFMGKGLGYASKRKKIKKTIEKKYSSYYAAAGTGLFGLTYTNWTIVACIMIGVMVLSFIFMLLEKKSYNKAEEELDEAKEEFARNESKRRDEEMQMMFMRMNGGGQSQGGYAYAQPSLGAEEMRGMISEVVTALLPGVQQMLPQQASNNDELVQKLIEQNAQNEEVIKNLAQGQEKLMKQLAKQQSSEKVVEREVASANVSEEVLDRLANKLQPTVNDDEAIKNLIEGQKAIMQRLAEQPVVQGASDETILKVVNHSEQNDETIKQLLKNQEALMEKILELSANQPAEPQVVEKIVEVPVEKIVEKEVPVEVEKVVEKIVKVPVEVEKIVEKEVVKEVPIEVEKIVEVPVVKEVPIEVEKVVEKIVEIPAEKPAPKAKTVAPRLTLDEAYEKLSAKQKKIFDTLKAYAMSKDKCKEKKSTYFIVLGQSSTNPLVKLTIKKDTTVALFKMEDEFMKDIRRNATNDGTKVKVKETELIVGDMQALATAKEMVDLREDQIERYNEYLREQRSMKK